MLRRHCLFGLLSAFLPLASMARPTRVLQHPQPESDSDHRNQYPLEMLHLALQKAGLPYETRGLKLRMSQNRALVLLQNRQLDVFWSMTSREREQSLLPVRVSLDRGLYGCRVFLIQKQRQADFLALQDKAQLARMVAVQGHDWPDTDILRSNGLQVVSSPNYELMFSMLQAGSVDYFPRSVIEIDDELRQHANAGLQIEESLLLQYPTALYFFVNRRDQALARALEDGLRAALQDGSFEQTFRP